MVCTSHVTQRECIHTKRSRSSESCKNYGKERFRSLTPPCILPALLLDSDLELETRKKDNHNCRWTLCRNTNFTKLLLLIVTL